MTYPYYLNVHNFDQFMAQAAEGDASAMFDVAQYLLSVHGFRKPDLQRGVMWLRRAVGSGHARAIFFLSEAYRSGRPGFVKDEQESDRLLENLTREDDLPALLRLGEIYISQISGDLRSKGLTLLKRAYDLGSPSAGLLIAKAEMDADRCAAMRWINSSIEMADEKNRIELYIKAARILISATHLKPTYGWGNRNPSKLHRLEIEQDTDEQACISCAVELLRKLAEQEAQDGTLDSVNRFDDVWESAAGALARIHLNTFGRFRDVKDGQRWLELAVSLDDSWAIYHMACLLCTGDKYAPTHSRWVAELALKRDAREAANLWHELAVRDEWPGYPYCVAASTSYAMCNIYGIGIAEDLAEGAGYLERSASEGDSFAQHELSLALECGRGWKKDTEKALSWASISAALGFAPSISLRDRLASSLSVEKVEEIYAESRRSHEAADGCWFVLDGKVREIRESFPLPWADIVNERPKI